MLPEQFFPQLQPLLVNAVKQSPRMLNRALDREIAENNRIQARANLLPSLGGWANYLESRDTRADLAGRLDVTKIAYNFSISQPVFFWGERANSAKMGEIQASIAKGQYREAYRVYAQGMRYDYLRLVVLKLTVQRSKFYLDYTKSQLAKEEVRLAQKVISDFQIFPVRLAAEQAQLTSERAQFEYDMAKASFARMAGCAPLTDDEIPDTIPAIPYNAAAYDQLLANYLSQKEPPTTEAVTMRKQMENAQLSLANAKTRLLPKLSATIGVSQDQQSYTINVAQKFRVNSIFAGFTANWMVFDGFSSQAAVRSEFARLRQMKTDYKEMTERLAQQAQTQARQLNFASRAMAITDRALTSSEGNLKGKQDDFSRGVTSQDDVSVARMMVFDAQTAAYNNRLDFINRTLEFLGTVAADPVLANVADVK